MLARIALLTLGAGAFAWTLAVHSTFWETALVQPLGQHVMNGDRLGRSVSDGIIEQRTRPIEVRLDRASYRRAMAAIHLSRVERAMENANSQLDDLMGVLDNSNSALLSISPIEPYFWLSRYWLINMREGFTERAADSLAMSYRTGPHEGWVSTTRNRFALAIFLQLPEATRAQVAAEFAGMVQSWMIGPASANLETVGWPNRSELLNQLDHVPIAQKTTLANTLQKDGFTVDVPGVDSRDPRPWH